MVCNIVLGFNGAETSAVARGEGGGGAGSPNNNYYGKMERKKNNR